MNEKMVRNFIIGVNKNLSPEKFSSLVNYFSITQGKSSSENLDLTLLPKFDSDIGNAKLTNWIKTELNYWGISTKRFNQGVRLLDKVSAFSDSDLNKEMVEYVKSIKPREKWLFIKQDKSINVNFSYDERGCYCKKNNTAENQTFSNIKHEEFINIDLLLIVKLAQIIHLELNIDNRHLKDTIDTFTHTIFIHEKTHLSQGELDNLLHKLRTLEKKDVPVNDLIASDFVKCYLKFEYEAWENASIRDSNFYRRRIANDALCNMSLTSYIIKWITEIYFHRKLNLPHEDTTLKVDSRATDPF